MKVFIVAIPLFDHSMTVSAYQLKDQSENKMFGLGSDFRRMNDALTSPGLDLVESIGLEPFTGSKPLFAEINRFQIFTGMPATLGFEPDSIIGIIPEEISTDTDVIERCRQMRERGYSFALDNFPTHGVDNAMLPLIDYIMLDYNNDRFYNWYKTINSKMPHVNAIVTNVPDMAAFKMLSGADHNSLFTGEFYNQPITKGVSSLSPVKINLLHLLNQVNQEDFDLTDIVKIIERDPYLTISLLRFINSGAVGLSRSIDSINRAVAILGQKEVRHWATVALSVSLAEDRPSEITKLSLTRAKFAENLAGSFELGVFQSQLFIAGLFSLLDVILEKPMAEAIKEVAVDDRVRKALVEKSGDLYRVLDLIYAYERAEWDKAQIIMIKNDIEIDSVTKAFVDSLIWYNQLLMSIDDDSGEEAPDDITPL